MPDYLNDEFIVYVHDSSAPIERLLHVGMDLYAGDRPDMVTLRFESDQKPDWPEKQVYIHIYWVSESVLLDSSFREYYFEEVKPGVFLYIWELDKS